MLTGVSNIFGGGGFLIFAGGGDTIPCFTDILDILFSLGLNPPVGPPAG